MQRELPRTFHIDSEHCACAVCRIRPLDLDEPRDITPTPLAARRAKTPALWLRAVSYGCFYLLGGNHADWEALQ